MAIDCLWEMPAHLYHHYHDADGDDDGTDWALGNTPLKHTHTPSHTTPSLSTFHADLAAFGLRSISSHFSHCLQPWAQISRAATHWNAAEMVLHIKQCAGAANWATCSQAE